MEVIITQAQTQADIKGIWVLQKKNLPKNISKAEAASQGFVTVDHTIEALQQMNEPHGHIIAKSGVEVVGYCLMMECKLKDSVPELVEMFKQIDGIEIDGKSVSKFQYMVMGQVCVDKMYRSTGIFARMYHEMANILSKSHDFIITEIDSKNKRSLRAHEKIGFEVLHGFNEGMVYWVIVGLKLK